MGERTVKEADEDRGIPATQAAGDTHDPNRRRTLSSGPKSTNEMVSSGMAAVALLMYAARSPPSQYSITMLQRNSWSSPWASLRW